ncbi:hypothetical protein CTEN210_03758 [Chaetoceros tenuissimus]|uniref:Uncharacterized protein n=1 Tax=Chaetoceros tenuissimus TaxID=426638 RepID=A0AAD3H246_9STRA|nr:hypothetical protein CTEN210_03758 [Chaetoceros tenuissimus]
MVKHKLMVELPSNPNVFILQDSTRNPYKQREKKQKSKIAILVSVTFAFGLLMGHGSHKIMSDAGTGSSVDKYYGADDDQTPGEFYDHSLEGKGEAAITTAVEDSPSSPVNENDILDNTSDVKEEEKKEEEKVSLSDSTPTEEDAAAPRETSPKVEEAASTPTENIPTLDVSVVDLDWFKTRDDHFNSWFEGDESTTDKLLENADQAGPILDFFIIGNNHCTADLTKALMHITPMIAADVCTPVHQTVWYSYQNWAKIEGNENKPLRGSHCSSFMGSGNDANAVEFSQHLPKTKLLVGIKHPVIWFKEFWDQAAKNKQLDRMTNNQDPYELTTLCTGRRCRHTCKLNQFFCMHRSRFHLGLARLGKTSLSDEERKYLAVDDEDGGNAVKNDQVKNPVFLYDDLELTGEYFWESLAKYLGVDHIPHDLQQLKESRLDHDKELANVNSLDFCKNEYDDLRARLLSYSYEMATWLQLYWVPLASDESRADVAVADPTVFNGLLEEYKKDPCNKLVRSKTGKFVVP